jgi:hypothetical protein
MEVVSSAVYPLKTEVKARENDWDAADPEELGF